MLSGYIAIPIKIKDMNKKLTISEKIMFLIRLDFLVSVSCSLKFMIVEYIPKHTGTIFSKSLEKVYDIYLRRGFIVYMFHMD